MLWKKQLSQREKATQMRASTKKKSSQISTVIPFVRHQAPANPDVHPSREGFVLISPAQWDYSDRQMGLGNREHFDGKLQIIPPAAHSLISWEVLCSPDYLHRLSLHQFQSEFIFDEYGWPRLHRVLQITFLQSSHISHGNISLGMIVIPSWLGHWAGRS